MRKELLVLGKINIAPLVNAHQALKLDMEEADTQLERDGLIKRFEYRYELSWKVLKNVLAFKGLDVNSPRDVFRNAAKMGLIKEPKTWFDFIDKRNLTSHAYNQEFASDVLDVIPSFEKEVSGLIETLKSL